MGDFFAELRRRHIYRVGAGYVVVAWALTQVVDVVAQIYAPPAWIPQAIVALLVIGFPVALAVAWMIEGKAHEAVASAVRSPATTVDWVLAGTVIAVLLFMGYQRFVPSAAVDTATADVIPAGEISIAVLPFTNMSGDITQEFFSDGITEEITTALAKIPDLRVVARTSAFQFKGQNTDVGAIGTALHASHLIEGSVRKQGDQLRITAQLIRASDGSHVWAENYNRELSDIFAVQEDIARAIAAALQAPLGLRPNEQLVANRTVDLEAYQDYLRARAQLHARKLDEAVATLEAVVARNPDYAPAWALLPSAYNLAEAYSQALLGNLPEEEERRIRQIGRDKEERAASESIRLDPTLPGGYVGLALVRRPQANQVAAAKLYDQALALDPNDTETLDSYSQWLVRMGKIKEALRIREQLHLLEPLVPIYKITTANIMTADGQSAAAIALLEVIPPSGGNVGEARNAGLAEAYAAVGRYREAADAVEAIPLDQNRISRRAIEEAAALLRAAPKTVDNPQALPDLGELRFVYAYVGAAERILDFLDADARRGQPMEFLDLWAPTGSSIRNTERAKTVLRSGGLGDFWRARGWPDLCHPTTGDDFECN